MLTSENIASHQCDNDYSRVSYSSAVRPFALETTNTWKTRVHMRRALMPTRTSTYNVVNTNVPPVVKGRGSIASVNATRGVPSGKHADEPRAPMSIRSIRQYRTTGHGTGSGKSNYAGEAHKLFSNSVIETGILRVAGWRVCR